MSLKYKLRTNVLIIAINDLLSKNLISLEHDPEIVCNGKNITEHEGIFLCTEYSDIGWGVILVKVKGKFNEDVNNEIPDVYFFMKGYLERQTGKYIMDSKCKCYDYYIKTKSKKSINKLKIMKMNEWINKYNHENIQPNGYQKYGQFTF